MIRNEIYIKLFYYLSLSDNYITSENLAIKLGFSIRSVKNQLSSIDFFLKKRGCHLESKKGYGYKLIVDDEKIYKASKGEITNYLKYSHSYKNVVNDIFSYIIEEIIFTDNLFSLDDISKHIYITTNSSKKYFHDFLEQLETFDLKLELDSENKYKIIGREKDLRLLAKDYLVIQITDILNHKYDFNKLQWINNKISFYEIDAIIQDILNNSNVSFFEVGKFRISCYFYISCHRLNNEIDIKMNNVKDFISKTDCDIANKIINKTKEKYIFLNFNEVEATSLALNIMCERDYTFDDIKNGTISNKLFSYTKQIYKTVISCKYMSIFKLFSKEEIEVWLISIAAKIIASNHKQNKPYFFYNDKSVYYSSFSFFIARLLASYIKKYGILKYGDIGPTLNIYCISYLTNTVYTNLMLVKPNCKKIKIGIYSFLGNLTSNSICYGLRNSSLSNYIEDIKIVQPNDLSKDKLDLIFFHQQSEHSIKVDTGNQYGFSSDNFIDQEVIYTIKAKYLQTSNYKQYFSIFDNLKIIVTNNIKSFNQIFEMYDIFTLIKDRYQIVAHESSKVAFLFVQEKNLPILDIYLLKDKFSYNNQRFKQLFVISCNLSCEDIMYYKVLEALSQVLSRNVQFIAENKDASTLKVFIANQIEKYLVETLI